MKCGANARPTFAYLKVRKARLSMLRKAGDLQLRILHIGESDEWEF